MCDEELEEEDLMDDLQVSTHDDIEGFSVCPYKDECYRSKWCGFLHMCDSCDTFRMVMAVERRSDGTERDDF